MAPSIPIRAIGARGNQWLPRIISTAVVTPSTSVGRCTSEACVTTYRISGPKPSAATSMRVSFPSCDAIMTPATPAM